jgi:hypothetical protein
VPGTASIGTAGGDVAKERQFHGATGTARRDQLDRPASIPGAANEALFLKVTEMFVNRGERRQIEAASDFFEARRVAVLLDELVEVIQDFPLTFGKRQHRQSSNRPFAEVGELYANIRRRSSLHRCYTREQPAPKRSPMYLRIALSASLALILGVAAIAAAALTPQQADAFREKVAIISQQGTLVARTAVPRRTSSARPNSIPGLRIARRRCCQWA